MKLKKAVSLAATALVCGALLCAPASATSIGSGASVGGVGIGSGASYSGSSSGYLYLNEDELELEIPSGSSYAEAQLSIVYAEDAYSSVSWSSSNTSVATVDHYGLVTGWSQGSAIITARTNTGAVGRCLVTVTSEKSSRLNTSFLYMNIEYNDPEPCRQLYLAETADYDRVTQWYSSNPAIASVDRNGTVTAHQEGVATIYASTRRGGTLTCSVNVQNNIGRVTLNESRLYLESIGAQGALVADIAVANPAAVPITWTSSNPAAAVVDGNGLVTAVGDGEAIITATSPDGHSDTCKAYTGTVGVQKKQEASRFFGLGGLFQDLFD